MKAIIFFITVSIFSFSFAADKDRKELAADNPFNVALNEPIDYASVTAEHVTSYVNVCVANAVMDLNQIKSNDQLSFENTLVAYDQVNSELDKAYSNAFLLNWVSTDAATRKAGVSGYQKIDSLFVEIGADKSLYQTFQAFANSQEGKSLTGNKKRLLEKVLDRFKNSAVKLDGADLEAFKRLSTEIKKLTTEYSMNMNTAEEFIVLSEDEVDGLPENFKNTYRTKKDSYKIPVIGATRLVESNASSSEVRKTYKAKSDNIASAKNLTILDSLVSKRYQLGRLMGYNSFAEYKLEPKMAKTPERVWEFINGLLAESKTKAIKDLELIKEFRNEILNTPNDNSAIDPWDIGYYRNQLLKTKYNLDYESMRDYFPMEECLQGMLDLYQELLGLKFRQVANASVWHEDVTMYEVYEAGKLKGRFYLDLFPRPNKETWFYAVPLSDGRQASSGYEVPVAMLLGNFTKPTDELPSLLSFDELSTLFHEFGHVVDKMSYQGEYKLLSSTKSDFVEAMSQIFENWVDDYDIISSFSKHYETGEVFPKSLFDRRLEVKNIFSGISAQMGLRYSMYDMHLYDKFDPKKPMDTDQLWKNIDREMGLMDFTIDGTHPQASWIHINSHPVYMYGYLWSSVYAQDMFTVFEENGLRDTKTGIRYRKLILANGGQKEVDDAVEDFIGRPMNNKAYIKSLGLE